MSEWFDYFGFDQMLDRLWLGAYPLDQADLAKLQAVGIDAIVAVTEDVEYPEGRQAIEQAIHAAKMIERRIPSPDLLALNNSDFLQAVTTVNDFLDAERCVYLHCRAGWQRSATIAVGVLMTRSDSSPDRALRQLQLARPQAQPLPGQWQALLDWTAQQH